jgi:hypothetical protein
VSAFVVLASAAAFADDLRVPRDYRTIEDALVVAAPGDRVVVRGGNFENVHVKKGAVEIVAHGTTVQGYVWIDASNVSVSGIRLGRSGHIVITGDDVTVTGTKATGRGRRTIAVQGGRRAVIEGNKLAQGDIEVLKGENATVTGNRLKDGIIRSSDFGTSVDSNVAPFIEVSSSQASLLDNRCKQLETYGDSCDLANNVVSQSVWVEGSGAVLQGNDVAGWITLQGDDAAISDNSLSTGGINVTGDGASILSNTVESSPLGIGVRGDDFTISGNDVTAVAVPNHDGSVGGFPMCPGIAVGGWPTGGTITDNAVTHQTGGGIVVQANDITISGNDVHGIASNTSILVSGNGNTVADNAVVQTNTAQSSGNGIDLAGAGNTVTGNDIGVVAQDAILVRTGTGNVLADNTIDSAPGCGVVIACGVDDTVIEGCTVSACTMGIVNAGTSTSMTGSTSQDNAFADILDLSTGFTTFEDNTYSTLSHDRVLAPASISARVID